ncbi:hypothetical protein OPV22_035039 [Ensete ventricosum]|uniref:Uncharacterized protein n=1 Tax=Ensete ventricosum TaxID=4639 RepID=A0AAV8NYK4_ENSVE|nr:hypothetical protein OPV22_035039 [Ensete ventricosum]
MDSRVNPAVDGTSGLRSTELVPHPVVSTVGGFGNEEQMKKLHGEATILAIGAANYLVSERISFLRWAIYAKFQKYLFLSNRRTIAKAMAAACC